MREHALEFCRIGPRHQEGLARFFQELMELGDHRWFHPHPFTAAQAECLAAYQGQDLYYVATRGEVVAYGMLRGWDEGYQVPSLGIAVHPAWRGRGLAHAFMLFLHAAARERGAPRIRLKVYPQNCAARQLYEGLGYQFEAGNDGQLVGLCPLGPSRAA